MLDIPSGEAGHKASHEPLCDLRTNRRIGAPRPCDLISNRLPQRYACTRIQGAQLPAHQFDAGDEVAAVVVGMPTHSDLCCQIPEGRLSYPIGESRGGKASKVLQGRRDTPAMGDQRRNCPLREPHPGVAAVTGLQLAAGGLWRCFRWSGSHASNWLTGVPGRLVKSCVR
jgi:hypothetical protein